MDYCDILQVLIPTTPDICNRVYMGFQVDMCMFSMKSAPRIAGKFEYAKSGIDITKRPTSRVQQIRQPVRFKQSSQINKIIQRSIPRRRIIKHRKSPINSMPSCFRIAILPDPKHAINHGVVNVKCWFGGGDVEVLLFIRQLGICFHG